MRRVVFPEAKKAVMTECEPPKCGDGQVLLKMRRVGVCGTDIQVFSGRNRFMTFPIVPFHEGIGTAVEVGKNVTNVKVGDTICVRPIIACHNCYPCRHGHVNACENFNSLGVQSNGLGSEYFAIDEEYCPRVSPDLPLDEAILIEPFAVGVHAARRGQVEGKKVLVVGAGTIGNFVAQAAQLLGAEEVAVCDISEEKVEMARKAGIALPIVSAGKTLREVAAEAFGPEPADVIIDCVGAKPLFKQILDAAAKTSTVVIVGNYSENVELNVAQIQRNELNFLGNITYTRDDFETAIRLFEERKVYVEGFISARFPIEQIQEGMDQAVTGKAHNMKTIFDY